MPVVSHTVWRLASGAAGLANYLRGFATTCADRLPSLRHPILQVAFRFRLVHYEQLGTVGRPPI
jgi:hypothetical protein